MSRSPLDMVEANLKRLEGVCPKVGRMIIIVRVLVDMALEAKLVPHDTPLIVMIVVGLSLAFVLAVPAW